MIGVLSLISLVVTSPASHERTGKASYSVVLETNEKVIAQNAVHRLLNVQEVTKRSDNADIAVQAPPNEQIQFHVDAHVADNVHIADHEVARIVSDVVGQAPSSDAGAHATHPVALDNYANSISHTNSSGDISEAESVSPPTNSQNGQIVDNVASAELSNTADNKISHTESLNKELISRSDTISEISNDSQVPNEPTNIQLNSDASTAAPHVNDNNTAEINIVTDSDAQVPNNLQSHQVQPEPVVNVNEARGYRYPQPILSFNEEQIASGGNANGVLPPAQNQNAVDPIDVRFSNDAPIIPVSQPIVSPTQVNGGSSHNLIRKPAVDNNNRIHGGVGNILSSIVRPNIGSTYGSGGQYTNYQYPNQYANSPQPSYGPGYNSPPQSYYQPAQPIPYPPPVYGKFDIHIVPPNNNWPFNSF